MYARQGSVRRVKETTNLAHAQKRVSTWRLESVCGLVEVLEEVMEVLKKMFALHETKLICQNVK
jgi:hypothetical protein